jgi:hypothetical protein
MGFMKKILLVMGFLLAASYGWGKIFLWTGNVSSDWMNGGNWLNDETAGGYPGTSAGNVDHVFIGLVSAGKYPPVLNSSINPIRSLTIDAGGEFTISTVTLTVTGDDSSNAVTGAPRHNSQNDPKPFVPADASVNNAVYQKGGIITLDGGTLATPNGSVYQTAGSMTGTGAAIQANKGIILNNSGSSNYFRSVNLTSDNGGILLENGSGGTLTIAASAITAGNVEITESGAIDIALGGIKTAGGGHVYLSAGTPVSGNLITQTGVIETLALQVKGPASGAVILEGDNKAGTLAALTAGASFSFTNADPLTVGSVTAAPGGVTSTVNGIAAEAGIITLRADSMTFNQPVGDYHTSSHVILRNKTGSKSIGLNDSSADLNIASVGNIKTKTLELGSRVTPSTSNITISSLPASPYEINTLILRCAAALTMSALGGSVTSLGIDCGGDATVSVNVANLAVDSGGDVSITNNSSGGFTITSLGSPAITGLNGDNITISAAGAVNQAAVTPVPTVTAAGTLTLGGTGAAYTLTAAGNNVSTLAGGASPVSVIYKDNDSFIAAGLTTTAGDVILNAGDGTSDTITVSGAINAGGNLALSAGNGASDTITVNALITAGGDVTLGTAGTGGSIALNADIASGGNAITLHDPVTLVSSGLGITIGRTGTANPAISFPSTLDGARNLVLNPGSGTVGFIGAVGASTPLGDGSGAAITIGSGNTGVVTFNDTLRVNGLLDIYPKVIFKKNVDIAVSDAANAGVSQLRGNVEIQGVTKIETNRSIAFGTSSANTLTGTARLDIVASGTSAALGTVTLNSTVSITGSSSGTPPRSLYIDAAGLVFSSISTATANGGNGGDIFFRIDGLAMSNINASTADVQITPRTDTHIIEFGDSNTAIVENVYYNSSSFGGITAGSFTIGDTNHNGKIYLSGTSAPVLPLTGINLTLQTKQDIEFTGDYASNGKALNLETSGGNVLMGGTGDRTINLQGAAAVPASITFNAPVEDAGSPGTHGLTVTAAAVAFEKPVGASTRLGAVAINHAGDLNIRDNAHIFVDDGFTETVLSGTPRNYIGGDITTVNNHIILNNNTNTFNPDNTLTQGVTFSTGSGDITIKGTVNGNSGAALTLAAGTGDAALEKPVSLSGAAFSSTGTGTVYLGTGSSSGNIATTGGNGISFGGDITLNNATTLSTGTGTGGDITITGHPLGFGAIMGNGRNLSLIAGTGNALVGGQAVNLGSGTGRALDILAAETTLKGDVSAHADSGSGDGIYINGKVKFDSSSGITMETLNNNGDITITGEVTAAGSGFRLSAHGTSASDYGTITLNSNISAPGDVAFYGDVALNPSGDTITVTTTAGNGDITFSRYSGAGGRVYGNGKNLNLVTDGSGEVFLNTDVTVGKSGNSAGTYALSVDSAKLTVDGTAGSVALDTSAVNGDMLFKVDGLVRSGTTAIKAGPSPGVGGDVRFTPRTATHTVEYGDVDTAIVTDVYYSSNWSSVTAGSFTVGDKGQTGVIYISDVGQSPYSPSAFEVTIRSGGGSNNPYIVLAGDYTSANKALNLVIDNDDDPGNTPPAGFVAVGYGFGPVTHTLDVGTAAIGIDAKIEGAFPNKSLALRGGDVTIKNTVGAAGLLETLAVDHGGDFTVNNGAHINLGRGFAETGTGAVTIGGNITVNGVGSAPADNTGIDFANGITITAGVTFTAAGTSGNADGSIAVPKGITRDGSVRDLTLNADTGDIMAANASGSLGTAAAPLGTVAITGGNVDTGPIFSAVTYGSPAVTVTNSGVFTIRGDITTAGGRFSQLGTGTVEIAPRGTEILRTITTAAVPGSGNISFAGSINGDGSNPMDLTLNAWTAGGTAGTITFANDAGNDASKPLDGSLTLDGNVAINKIAAAAGPFTLKARGNIVFGNSAASPAHTATLTSGGMGAKVNVETALAAGTVTFNGPIDGGVDFAVTGINGAIVFNGAIGGVTPVGAGADAFTAAAAGTGTIFITKDLAAAGDIALNGKVQFESGVDLAVTANDGKINLGTAAAHTVTLANSGTGSPQVTIQTNDTMAAAAAARTISFAGPVTGNMNLLVKTSPQTNPGRSLGEVVFGGTVDVGSSPKRTGPSEPYALKVDAEKLALGSSVSLITRYGGDVMMRVNGLDPFTGTHYLYAGTSGAPGSTPTPTVNGMAQITTREEGMEIEYGDSQKYSSSGPNPVAFFMAGWTAIYAQSYTIGDEDHYGAIYFTGVANSGFEITVDNSDTGGSGPNRGIVRFEDDYTTSAKKLNLKAKGIEIAPLDFSTPLPPQNRPAYPGVSPYSPKASAIPVTINLGTADLTLDAPVEGSTATPYGDDGLILRGGNITLEKTVGAARALGTLEVEQGGVFTAKADITASLGFTENGGSGASTAIAPADNNTVTITAAGNPVKFKNPVNSGGINRSLVLTTGTAPAGSIAVESAVNLSGSYTQTCAGTAVIGTSSASGNIKAGVNIVFQGGGTVTGVDTGGSAEIDTDLTLEAGANYGGTVTINGAATTVKFNRLIVNANAVNNGIISAGQITGPAAPIDGSGANQMTFGDGPLPYPAGWINDFALIFNNGYSGSGKIAGISGNADDTYIAFRADTSLLSSAAPSPVIAFNSSWVGTDAPRWLVFLGNITQLFDSGGGVSPSGAVPNVLIAHEYHTVDNPSSAPTGVRLRDPGAAETTQTGEKLVVWRGFLDLNGKKWRMIHDYPGTYPPTYSDDNGFGGYKGTLTLGKVQTNKPIGEIQAGGDGTTPSLAGGFTLWAGTGFTLELLADADPNAAVYTPNRISSSGAVNLYPNFTSGNPDTLCPGWRELAEAELIFTGNNASFSTGLEVLAAARPAGSVPGNTVFSAAFPDPVLTVGALTVRAGTADLRSDLSVQGNVTIEAVATLKADYGGGRYIVVRGGTDTVRGGWYQRKTVSNTGTFVFGGSTVNFTGKGPNPVIVIEGNTTWWNFVCETNLAVLEFSTAANPVSDFHEFKNLLRVWPQDNSSIMRMSKNLADPRFNAGENHDFSGNPSNYTDYGAFWHIKLDTSTASVEMYLVNVFYSYAKIPIALPAGVYANPYNESSDFPNWGFHFCMYWVNLKTFVYSFTEDSDGNGKIDRMRVQATLLITTPDFTGFKTEVEGYEIDASRGSGGYDVISHSMDSIYIYLKEKPYQDGGATPRWRVLAGGNLRLNEYIAVEPFQSWMYSVDTVPPKVSYALMLPVGAASTRSDLFIQLAEPMVRMDGARYLTINIPTVHNPYSGSNRYIVNQRGITMRNTYYMEYLISFNKADGFSVEDLAKGEMYFTIENGRDLALPVKDLFDPNDPKYPSPKYPKNWNYDEYVTIRGNSGRYIDENGRTWTAGGGSVYTDESGNPIGDGTGVALIPPNRLPPPAALLPGAPANKYSHRVTDVLISLPPSSPSSDQYFMWPVWAKTDDSPTTVTVGSGWAPAPGTGQDDEYGLIWDFTGLRALRDKNISLLGELHNDLLVAGFSPSLFYASSVHDSFRAGSGNGPVGLWLPYFNQNDFSNIVPKPFTGTYQKSPESGPPPPQYVFSLNNSHYDRGSSVEFFYRLDGGYTPFYAARLDMVRGGAIPEDWYRRIKPFSFRIMDNIFQRGGVTILNNVIDPTRGEKTYLEYSLNRSGRVTIQIFTLDGSLVQVLQRGSQGTGTYRISWDGRNRNGRAVARGMYFIRAVGPEFDETRKVMVVK